MQEAIYFTGDEMLLRHRLEENLKRAYLYDYKRATTSKDDEIVRNILLKYGFTYGCNSCPNVVYQMYRQCGELYFQTKNKPVEEEPSPIQNKEIKNDKIKKRRKTKK
mgnify:FL=1